MTDHPEPSRETLLRGFRLMVLSRVADERCLNLQRQGRIGFYVQMEGQEAAQVGCGLALEKEDWIFPAYRELGVALSRGIPLERLFSQFYGNSSDPLKGRQMPCHYGYREERYVTASSPVGTQILHAVGAALAARYKGDKLVTIAFFGDGATSTVDFHSGMNFAGVYRAPVVFFCQNNGWAISLPREKQTRSETLAMKAEAYGFSGVQVDGNDFVAVYSAVKAARENAMAGGGPTMIEAVTFRMGGHSTSDDPSRYRTASLVASWKEKDPIERLKRVLLDRGYITEGEADAIQEEARDEVQKVIHGAESLPPPEAVSLFDDVTEKRTPELEEERAEFIELLKEGVLKQ
jgi:2-oxoisovalerate dehydrogenase E1 component alpha subunit